MAQKPPAKSFRVKDPYCICNSFEAGRFMISCDNCSIWYHGHCIKVSTRAARKIDKYYCSKCIAEDPELKIVYKEPEVVKKKKRTTASQRKRRTKQQPTEWRRCTKCVNCVQTDSCGACMMCAANPPQACLNRLCLNPVPPAKPASSSTSSGKGVGKRMSKGTTGRSTASGTGAQKKSAAARPKRCHQCIGCFRNKNCNKCNGCKERSSKKGRMCYARMCVMWPAAVKKRRSSAAAAASVKCNAEATTVVQTGGDGEQQEYKKPKKPALPKRSSSNNADDADDDDRTATKKGNGGVSERKQAARKGLLSPVKDEVQDDVDMNASLPTILSTRSKKRELQSLLGKEALPQYMKAEEEEDDDHRRRRRHVFVAPTPTNRPVCTTNDALRKSISQCRGLRCRKKAVGNSKYCSDKCGLQLAMTRLERFLQRDQAKAATSSGDGEKRVCEQLVQLQQQQYDVFARLGQLDSEEERLKQWIDSASKLTVTTDEKKKQPYPPTVCVLCANVFVASKFPKHIITCWSKIEKRLSWGAPQQSRNTVFSLLCDQFNKSSKTYCKRLKVICPEHTKHDKLSDQVVCGAPLSSDLDDCGVDNVCRLSKKMCEDHFRWELYSQAKLDMERMLLLLKLDNLDEQTCDVLYSHLSEIDILEHLLNRTNVSSS